MFHFTSKPGADNYGDCDGCYVIDLCRGVVNGKPVYVNTAKGTFLASLQDTAWCITGLEYLEEIQTKNGNFGGFHAGGSKAPDEGEWTSYNVKAAELFRFLLKAGCENYANCDGDYMMDETKGEINGKPVYFNSIKDTILAAVGNVGWSITGINYLQDIQHKQGSFGGYHSGGCHQPDDGEWKNYSVEKIGGQMSKTSQECGIDLDNAASWCKLENTTVAFKAVANSGAIRSERDFLSARRRCVELNCGGFAWRKPHFNQFGEEDDPPICFFFRKTQAEIRSSLECNEKFDLYIASDEFCPDCSFKPGRDPAPSCHIGWQVGKPVHAFACQIKVPIASEFTFYCACGFHCGYCGIQQHGSSKQQIIFSVWDHSSAPDRVHNSYAGNGIVAEPFGGEGKGMKASGIIGGCCEEENCSIAKWEPGETYTFVVRATPVRDGTEYACFVHKPDSAWTELARHVRPEPCSDQHGELSGLYSFIEDFAGNSVRRSCSYAAWVQDCPGAVWRPVTEIVGTSTVDADIPNKCVRIVPDSPGTQRVEMISGGDRLDDCSLAKGCFSPPAVPDILQNMTL